MFRVFIYRDTFNLGDAIQTFALCRLLGEPCFGIYRDEQFPIRGQNLPLIVNGWLGWSTTPKPSTNCVFAGVHVGWHADHYVDWLRNANCVVGARDPYTHELLQNSKVGSEMIGCATLTLPRYQGPRSGKYSVDVAPYPGTIHLTNSIAAIGWSEQWELAATRLDQLRKAAIVYTKRLHVILPCLAFGTPVILPSNEWVTVCDKRRMSLLHALGFELDREMVMDVSDLASTYVRFVERTIGRSMQPTDDSSMPVPLLDVNSPATTQ